MNAFKQEAWKMDFYFNLLKNERAVHISQYPIGLVASVQ